MKSKCGDPRRLTFSQAQGYESLPQRLKLEELSNLARTKVWDVFFGSIEHEKLWGIPSGEFNWWDVLQDVHLGFDNLPLDQWDYENAAVRLRESIMTRSFNRVFDLIQFILRHPKCPTDLADAMKKAFEKGMVAYVIDDNGPPTIFPAGTTEEGQSLIESLHTLQQGGLSAAEDLLRKASTDINRGDWAGSIKNSISAAESVGRKLYPQANTFGGVVTELKKDPSLWPSQLVQAMKNIWSYTNQKNVGIRHGSPDPTGENVGQEEALFMLGTCASIASYLWRKHADGECA